ncbi:MAG: TIGR00341 family protein [Thioploca sp.]|nr:TIGR00341 family protein [Thioploca sp.]
MKIIEIVTTFSYQTLVKEILEQENIKECWLTTSDSKGQLIMQLLVTPERYQSVLDALQRLLMFDGKARIIVLPVEIVLPIAAQGESPIKFMTISRETLYQQVESNARVDSHFMLLVFLSTIVAAIGLLKDNVAVVIGAMVIAPLLGPNLALALAAALGSKPLLWQAVKSNLVGLGGSLLLTILLALLHPVDLNSHELISRTEVGIDSIILALAAGIVAVLSLTSGLSMT